MNRTNNTSSVLPSNVVTIKSPHQLTKFLNFLSILLQTTQKSSSVCNGITLELRFVFSIIAHTGNLLAPLLFIVLNVNLRQSLMSFIRGTAASKNSRRQSREMVLDDMTVGTSVTDGYINSGLKINP